MSGRTVLPGGRLAAAFALTALLGGCAAPKLNLFSDSADPLREFTLEGTGKEKVLVVNIQGPIHDTARKGLFRHRPGIVEETVSHLRKAEKDRTVKALLLKIDSPGGTVTASDVLYHEIAAFRKRAGIPVVAALMKTATSGAYYIALPADYIIAHPTTVTGSTGVIFLRPKVAGLIEKIGVGVEVHKSGELKDLGNPFRADTDEERRILQGMIDEFGRRFVDLVARHRRLGERDRAEVARARIYLAAEAAELGLVDGVGYLGDAITRARQLAGLGDDARVVVYRRREYPDDSLYNTAALQSGDVGVNLIDLGLPGALLRLEGGFYYLWLPALGEN